MSSMPNSTDDTARPQPENHQTVKMKKKSTDEMPLTVLSRHLRAPFYQDYHDETIESTATNLQSKNETSMTINYRFDSVQTDSVHPNFDPKKSPLDPDRPLSLEPSADARYERYLQQLLNGLPNQDPLGQLDTPSPHAKAHIDNMEIPQALKQFWSAQPDFTTASKWALIASPELATHFELLQLGGLINLPQSFFTPVTPMATSQVDDANQYRSEDLLTPLTDMQLLDLSSIYHACADYPMLTRYGFSRPLPVNQGDGKKASKDNVSVDMINDGFSPTWEVILYPERFDNGVDSLTTDILACSVAVHILKQCQTRKTVNRNLTAMQICQHMRSYVLNQCNLNPQFEAQYRQIRLFVGHVVVAASHLGLTVSHNEAELDSKAEPNKAGTNANDSGQSVSQHPIYFNLSSRSVLFTRYPNISEYYINGWR